MYRIGGKKLIEDVQFCIVDNVVDLRALSCTCKYYNKLCNSVAYDRLMKLKRKLNDQCKNYVKLLNVDITHHISMYNGIINDDIEKVIYVDINFDYHYPFIYIHDFVSRAIYDDRLEILKYFIIMYHPNEIWSYHSRFLHKAIKDNAYNVAKYIISEVSDESTIKICDDNMQHIVSNDTYPMLELLLENNLIDSQQMNIIYDQLFHSYCNKTRRLKMVKILHKYNVLYNHLENVMLKACYNNDIDLIKYVLTVYKINDYDKLMIACIENKNDTICNLLVSKGATYECYYNYLIGMLAGRNEIKALNYLVSCSTSETTMKRIIKNGRKHGIVRYLTNMGGR